LEKNLVIDIFLKPGFVNSQSFVNFNLIFINLVNMKRFFPFIAAILLLSTCKKGTTVTPNPPLLDVLGKWSLYSSKQPGSDVTVAQLPCLADNILQINADGTTTAVSPFVQRGLLLAGAPLAYPGNLFMRLPGAVTVTTSTSEENTM